VAGRSPEAGRLPTEEGALERANRCILHIDMDAFFAAVEAMLNERYRGKPLVVGGDPSRRGVVATASYEARRFGIRSGMSLAEAYYRCPHAVFVEGNPHKYVYVSGQVLRILKEASPRVEPYSIDEAFLEMDEGTTLEEGMEAGRTIKHEIRSRLGLTCSIGVAPNRYLAKMASGVTKPDGLTTLDRESFRRTFWGKPTDSLFGVGAKTAEALRTLGILTVRQLAVTPVNRLRAAFGVNGEGLKQIANGIDNSPVTPYYEEVPQKSLGHEVTLEADEDDRDRLLRLLLSICEEVGRDMRKEDYQGRVVVVKMRFADFKTITRQRALGGHTDDSESIFRIAKSIFILNWPGAPLRLLGVSMSGLSRGSAAREPELFDTVDRRRVTVKAVDALKDRFGEGVLRKAAEMRYDSA
jgi:DNA polymerase-4